MNYRLLFTSFLLKEIRTLTRDRQQMMGLAIAVIALFFIFISQTLTGQMIAKEKAAWRATQKAAAEKAAADKAAAEPKPTIEKSTDEKMKEAMTLFQKGNKLPAETWTKVVNDKTFPLIASLGAAVVSMYCALLAIAGALSVFVGEKEEGTLEVLLSAPISDGLLYSLMCGTLLLLLSIANYVVLGGVWAWAFALHADKLAGVSSGAIIQGILFGLPFPILANTAVIAMGAMISVRADSMKGAGQLFGAVTLGIFIFFGIAGIVIWNSPLKTPVFEFAKWWIELSFALQYSSIVGLIAGVSLFLLILGRLSFSRERLVR